MRTSTLSIAIGMLHAAFASQSIELGQMPGLAVKQCFKSFSGYLDANNRSLFHFYHEAITEPDKRPVVLWLNGGPGCSSVSGMFTELGPYVVGKDQNLTLNPYAWNKVANMLFLEQPAGVGFSYPQYTPTVTDAMTAADTYAGLLAFFEAHPELEGRSFYVAGESYGGHYIPNIVKAVEEGNAALPKGSKKHINLVGFAVGNGYTDWQLDFNANVENGRFHALTSESLFTKAKTACGGNYARCFWPRPDKNCPADCDAAVKAATEDAMNGSIDIYDIYEDVCLEPGQERVATQMFQFLQERRKQQHLQKSASGLLGGTEISPIFPTCIDNYAGAYLNSAAVQKAIGIRPGTVPNGKWTQCSPSLNYTFNYESELSNYKQWTAEGKLQILIYNGDADYILSHMGNSAWINQGLKLPKSSEWSPWRGSDKQVAGYWEQYKTGGVPLTFLTVKGAGHMVPKDRPRHALDMLTQFLKGDALYSHVTPAPELPLCPATPAACAAASHRPQGCPCDHKWDCTTGLECVGTCAPPPSL